MRLYSGTVTSDPQQGQYVTENVNNGQDITTKCRTIDLKQ